MRSCATPSEGKVIGNVLAVSADAEADGKESMAPSASSTLSISVVALEFTVVEGMCSVAPEDTTMLLMMYDAPAFI